MQLVWQIAGHGKNHISHACDSTDVPAEHRWEDVRHILSTGETIEEYPDDTPYPSRLIAGWIEKRPVHIVVADNIADNETIIITVYEPESDKWSSDFRRRIL